VRRGHAAVVAAIFFGGVSFAFATIPWLQFAYHGLPLRIALETAASLIALFADFLVYGRLRRYRGSPELLVACALAMLALVNFCLLIVPLLPLSPGRGNDLLGWVLLAGRLLAACLLAGAAFGQHRLLRRPSRALAVSVAAGSTVVLVVPAVLIEFAGFTRRFAAALAPASAQPLGPRDYPALAALQLATAVIFGVGAVGFFRRSRRLSDEFVGWLAISGFLAGLSLLNYSLYPAPITGNVHAGDIFRLWFYLTLLAGSMREIWSYWLALSQAAVLEERQRIARDLHDGLAQELACVARNLDSLDGPDSGETLAVVRGAVRRAQLESRRAVSALAAVPVAPVEVALAEAAVELSQRLRLGLRLDLACGTAVPAARQDALVRIATEAITNAARHSGASEVHLELERDGPHLRLRVSDRGRGFDPAAAGGGFGLTSMRQRAHAAGGELRITSAAGAGSEVEAAF
jgi:signal transduction histidine kinase